MNKIISEDALRRSLARMSAQQSQAWLAPQLLSSVQATSNTPWILDIDTTIKALYGKQSGAQVSCNPHKPGRPSHALHTYWVGNLRLVLDVVASPGKEHSAAQARPGLGRVLDQLTPEQRPALVRGDCSFGNELFIAELEDRGQHPRELMAGISALGKRLRTIDPQTKAMVLDLKRMLLIGPEIQVEITASDALVLSALARAPGHKLERWQIAEIVGGTDTPSAATLEMRISRLRKKLASVGAPPPHIKALHKVGYTLCTPVVMQ